MTINSALVELRLPAAPTATGRGIKVIAVTRRLVGRPPWSQERLYLNIGDSYRTPDRPRRSEGASNWLHTHH
jgi:hypothetical protein